MLQKMNQQAFKLNAFVLPLLVGEETTDDARGCLVLLLSGGGLRHPRLLRLWPFLGSGLIPGSQSWFSGFQSAWCSSG